VSELRLEPLRMPAARLGPDNPLPRLAAPPKPKKAKRAFDETIAKEDRKYFGYGMDCSVLPYRLQDDYDRARNPREFKTAVLENDTMRASFLLEMGGRLWSLIHKPSGRELLQVNSVFQPSNLAVRNAWITGGVEWNGPTSGHGPRTCAPMFAARVTDDNGEPILRIYEWDRIRCIPVQMDFWLPPDLPVLFARIRLVNPHDCEIPCYWWSNIAVAERQDVRVIVPADEAYVHGYDGKWTTTPLPLRDGVDVTYSTNGVSSKDYFYRIPNGRRPWIAAVDGEGRGLVQASTARLKGRKLFLWGMAQGGRNWQSFLGGPGEAYIELQAGLCRTQGQSIPMPAGAEWSWLEAYGLAEVPPEVAHGADWPAARAAVEARLDKALPQQVLEERLEEANVALRKPLEEILHRGAGWGALERRRRERAGAKPFCDGEIAFDDESLGGEQAPWLALLEQGELPCLPPAEEPGAWMVQPEWVALLQKAIDEGRGDHWLSWLHLGVMYYHAGQTERAEKAWRTSIEREPSGWAWRNLAVAAMHEGRDSEALDLWATSCKMLPASAPLAVEYGAALRQTRQWRRAMQFVEGLGDRLQEHPRMQLLKASAALELGDLDEVERFLDNRVRVTDTREGERTLAELWFSFHEKKLSERENTPIDDALRERVRREFPPPQEIDFRQAY